jgi:hypothetical protein
MQVNAKLSRGCDPTLPSYASMLKLSSGLRRCGINSRGHGTGLLITYTIMLGDVLVGKAPGYNGVITNIVGNHTGDVWYLDRRFVVCLTIYACHFAGDTSPSVSLCST